jgi:hypothetical protein
MTFKCRLSVVDGARYVRISRARLGGTLSPFREVQSRTVKLVKGRATVRLRLSPAEFRRVRRAGRRGVRMVVRARALSSTKKVLTSRTKRTKVRR